MTVLQINSVCGFGSTGRNCVEIARALKSQGHDCYIAYGQGTTRYEHSYKIGTVLENHAHNALSRMSGKQGYWTVRGTKKLIRYIEQIKPDIIHLHNLHGNYLHLEVLFKYLATSNKPIVWSLHDCWAYTGKCSHYADVQCYKWKTHCNHCPQVHSYPPSIFFDRSYEMFSDKKKWFSLIKNMTLAPVSNWLAGEVKESFLNIFPIQPVYNWVDRTVFTPSLNINRAVFGIDTEKFVILGVSAAWKKMSNKFKDFIALSKIISDNCQIVLVGRLEEGIELPPQVLHIPYVENTEELANLYSIADVYVHLSTEDTFGKVIAEAMSCGTPAIVYNATACPELIGEGCGFIIEKRDVAGICEAINTIKKEGKGKYTDFCRRHVKENYDYKKNTDTLIDLYQKMLV
jgi:glycosyltransferase involved in cell wall biosynthesis